MELHDYINNLVGVNSTIQKYVDNKLYIPTYEDADMEVDDKTILNGCYEILISELNDIGIRIHCDIDEILGNFYDANRLYLLYRTIYTKGLYLTLVSNNILYEQIGALISEENVDIFSVLREISKLHPSNEDLIETIEFLDDKLVSNKDFIEYIVNIYDSIDKALVHEFIVDTDTVLELTNYITVGREMAKKIYDLALSLDNSLDGPRLIRDYRLYNMDKLQADRINRYVMWLSHKDDPRLTLDVKRVIDKIHADHTRDNNHHVEYFEHRKSKYIDKIDLINILANLCDPGDGGSKAEIWSEFNQIYATLELLTAGNIEEGARELCKAILNRIGQH